MSSQRQIEANRLNAQKSTGPCTVEGKAVSSMNALKSGIDAQSAVILGEDPAAFEALTEIYYRELAPRTALERFYVDILVRNDWLLRRFDRVEAELWKYKLEYFTSKCEAEIGRAWDHGCESFARLQRRRNDVQRSTMQARQELAKLKAEPAPDPPPQPEETAPVSPQIGFVPPIALEPLAPAPSDPPSPAAPLAAHPRLLSSRLNLPTRCAPEVSRGVPTPVAGPRRGVAEVSLATAPWQASLETE